MADRVLTTPELVAGAVAVGAGDSVTLPCGRTWGLRAVFQVTGTAQQPARIFGFATEVPGYARPLSGGDLTVTDTRTLTLELRADPAPAWYPA